MQMIYWKTFVFSVFVCILENSLKNILQCLEQSKMKIKINKLETAVPPPQTTENPPQTTINNPQTHHHSKTRNPTTVNHRKSTTNHHKQPTNPPSQQNPLHQNQEQTKNKQIKTHKSNKQIKEQTHTGSHRIRIWCRLRSQTGSRDPSPATIKSMADRCSCSSPHRAAQRLAKLRRASSLRPSSKIRARARGSLGPTAIQSRDLNTIPGEISTVSISIVGSKAVISTHGAY
jgi:hypothetical protein